MVDGLKIAVCDDEKIFCDKIIQEMYNFFGKLDLTCAAFYDGEKLITAYESGIHFDAVFLDIEMPIKDGMETAKALRNKGFEAPIIFLTSHTEMAMDGYEVSAFRFLSKPIQEDKLQKTLKDLKRELREKKRLMIRYEGEEVVIFVDDILYVEAMNNQVSLVTVGGEYTVRKKISDMEHELKEISDCFVRIHRGYIVNLVHVKKHHGNEIFIMGDHVLPLSRSLVNDFKKQLFQYVRNSAR
ncbi:MAG: LytTR family DNA-binding domain-containing protein [Clostridiales bacterium]|nr:LytTR family DNA-binding domain-containing protein [Clostridiales bacterium]